MEKARAPELIIVAILGAIVSTQGRRIAADMSTESEEDHLARGVDDPTAILAQLKFEDLYTPQNYSTTAQTNTLQLRPVLPIQPFAFFPLQQLIRPTLTGDARDRPQRLDDNRVRRLAIV